MTEYRPVDADHRERLESIHRHAFEPERGPLQSLSGEEWPPELSEPRGVFDGDDLVSVCVLYTLEATVRGEWTEIGGLGGVATPPEHRHEGNARTLLRNALEEYRDDGVAFVTLWPASTQFYRAAGWATANRYAECDVTPSALSVVSNDAPGQVRPLSADDWERLRSIEEHRAERVGLSLRRSEQWWRERTLPAWTDDSPPYLYGYERDGELRGYVVYRFESHENGVPKAPNDDRRLDVQDLAALDQTAERALLAFLADHDSQAETIRLRGQIAEDCFHRGVDPDAMDCSLKSGAMVRVADVALALERHDWSELSDVSLDLAVSDPLLEHDDGRFRVAVEDGAAAVMPADSEGRFDATEGADEYAAEDAGRDTDSFAGALRDEPALDASVDVGTLSQLCVGSIGVDRAEQFGGLEVHTEHGREALQTAFEPVPVCLREFF